MRIAYVCTDFGIPVYGTKGASIHVRELSRALQDLGHDVVIYSPRVGGEAPPDFRVPVREVALERQEKMTYRLLRDDPGAGEAAAKEIRSMLYAASLRSRLLPELREFRPDAVYERYSLLGTAGLGLARDLGVPLILEVNAPLSEEQAAHRRLSFARTARRLERDVLRAADGVVAVSGEIRRWLVGVGVEAERITVLSNAVDVARFAAAGLEGAEVRERLQRRGGPVVGFVGTLKPWHGTGTLLRAVAELHGRGLRPHLLIVGDGPERAGLEELAGQLGIAGATTFAGAVPHARVPAHIGAMDIAVAPYDRLENFYFSPLKLFEYMAAGRPVVAAAAGQIADCVRHGETGWLYPPGDVVALADALAVLLEDPDLAARLGRAGREDVRAHHTWAGNARAVATLADAMLPRHEGVA